MISSRTLSLTLLFLVLLVTRIAAAQEVAIRDWQPEFKQQIQDLSSTPESVLSVLKNIIPSEISTSLEKAQHHLLLSKTYYALSIADDAIKHAHLSLSYIDSVSQPWLYYRALLALSMALNMNGVPEEGLIEAKQLVNPFDLSLMQISLQKTTAELLYSQGEYQSAFELLQSALAEKEKMLSQLNSKQLHSLRSQYEIDVKESENKFLEQENRMQQSNLYQAKTANSQLLLLFGSTLIICALLAMMAFRTKQHRERLEEYANTDGLTGLLNRRRALELIELQFDLAKRHQYPISMAIADIDLFKKLNDTYGHALGDKVLEAFGELCKSTFRNTDIIGRIGGEEFVIVLPHTSIDDAEITLRNLSSQFKKLASSLKVDKLSISCGLAQFESNLSISDIMLKCDQALYNAKHQGRDQVLKFKTLHSNVLEPYGESSAN